MGKQTGSISFEATGGFNSYAKQNYATLSQIKGQFATCETGTNTAAKVATIVPSNTGWGLYPGATVTVKFSNANSATGTLTLNVNGSGAKEIRDYNGNNLEQAARAWSAGAAMALTYDGTYWRIQDSNLIERMHTAETEINQTATSITSLASMQDTYTKPDGTSGTNSMKTYVDQTAEGINTTISGMQTDISNKADGSTVTTLSNTVNSINDTVSGHTQSISSINSTITTKADKSAAIVETTQLWYSKANTTAPNKPTAVVTSTSTDGNAWRVVVPAYNSSYPNYFYCYQWKYADGNYGWSAVTRDIAMGETQERARTAISNAATADGKAVAAQNTANANIKSSVMLWFTKANDTAPNKPTSQVTTANAATGNAWNLIVPTYNAAYPNYFYCYQYQKGNGDYAWSDVIFDRATTESQSTARAASSSLANYITSNNEAMQLLQNQVDGQVEAWYMSADPTTSNAPASTWSTNEEKARHKGDLYYNITNGHSWRWLENNGTYSWQQIPDSDAAAALAAAQDAQTTANGKRRIFTVQPTTPYDIGDLWVDGSQVKYATVARASGNYVATDWDQTATDDTLAQTAKDVADKNVKESIQLWFTKANTTAPNKPTTAVTNNNPTGTNSYNKWNIAVPVYNENYKYYFYCYQWKLADGTYDWSSVVYDQATTENQANSRAAKALAEETQEDYADFKQTVNEFQSTIGSTYATKTELSDMASGAEITKEDFGKREIITEDATELPLITLTAYGECAQDGTPTPDAPVPVQVMSGRNLIVQTAQTKENRNVAFEFNSTPSVHVSGTPSQDWANARSDYVPVNPNTVYTASLDKLPLDYYDGMYVSFKQYNENREAVGSETLFATWAMQHNVKSKKLTTVEQARYIAFDIGCRYVGAAVDATIYLQLEAGAQVTPYTPYGHIAIISTGNNLIDPTKITLYGCTGSITDGTINVTATTGSASNGVKLGWFQPGTYTINADSFDGTTVYKGSRLISNLQLFTNWSYNQYYPNILDEREHDAYYKDGVTYPLTFTATEQFYLAFCVSDTTDKTFITTNLRMVKGDTDCPYSVFTEDVSYIDMKGHEAHGLNETYRDILNIDASGHVTLEKRTVKCKGSDFIGYKYTDAENAWGMSVNHKLGNATVGIWSGAKSGGPIPKSSIFLGTNDSPWTGVDSTINHISGTTDTYPTYFYCCVSKSDYPTIDDFNTALQNELANSDFIFGLNPAMWYTIDLGYITLPKSFDNGIVHASAEIQPVIDASWWTKAGELTGKQLKHVEQNLAAQKPYIIGTQTTATYDWTGNCPELSELKEGQQITYVLPYSVGGSQIVATYTTISSGATTNTSGASLTLILADGSSTGQIPIWYGSGMGRITTQYAYGSIITMTYRENAIMSGTYKINKGWFVDAEYNSDTVYSRSISGGFYTGLNGVLSYGLCMKDENGRWTAIVNNKYSNTTQDKTPYTGGLDPSEILYCSTPYTGGRVATNNTSVSGDLWASYILDFRFSTNISANSVAGKAMTVRQPVYLVGTFNNKGLFVLDSAQWWTQTIPIATDDKVYIYLGTAYSWYQLALADRNPFYEFKNGKFQEFSLSRISNAETEIIQTKEQIALKANSSDVYTKTSVDGFISKEITDRNAAITEASNAISLSVSQNYTTKTEFNNLEIGGRNFLLGSSLIGKYGTDVVSGSGTRSDTGGYLNNGSVSVTNAAWGGPYIKLGQAVSRANLQIGDTITLSIMVSTTSATEITTAQRFFLYRANSSGNFANLNNSGSNTVSLKLVAGRWEKLYATFELTEYSLTANQCRFEFGNAISDTIIYSAPKLEKGNKVTDWTPAPEDVEAYTDSKISEAKLEIDADGIRSEVAKINSAKYVNSSTTSWSLANIKIYSAEGHSESWNVASTENFRVGDTVYVKGTDSTRNCPVYIKTTVTRVNSINNFTGISHGYEDVLPVETIKSTINQSSDSVKIQANHIEIDGTATFKNGNATTTLGNYLSDNYDSKGAAQEAVNNLEIGGRNLLHKSRELPYNSPYPTAYTDDISKFHACYRDSSWGNNTVVKSEFVSVDVNGTPATARHKTWYASGETGNGVETYLGYLKSSELDKLTVSVWVKHNHTGKFEIRIRFVQHDGITGTQQYIYETVPANQWTRVVFRGADISSFTDGAVISILLFDRQTATSTSDAPREVWIALPQVEMGNLESTWTPAPEDTDATIAEAQAAAIQDTDTKLQSYSTTSQMNTAIGDYVTENAQLQSYHRTHGTSGQVGIFHLATIRVKGAYCSQGISLVCMHRSYSRTEITIALTNANNLDPGISTVKYTGNRVVYMARSAESIYELYVTKAEGYDDLTVVQFDIGAYMTARVDWTWASDQVSSVDELPEGYVTGQQLADGELKAYYASQTALNGVSAVANAAAPKANAVKRTQRIYFRAKNTISTWSMPTTWVTNANDTWNDSMSASGWSTKITPMSKDKTSNTEANKYLYLYTCEQREMADGNILYTPVLLDDTTTIIDGGNIITGTVTANQLNATNINASNMLTVGAFQENTQNDILNSNIQIGGRNLVIDSKNFRAGSVQSSSTMSQTVENGMYKMTISEGNTANWNSGWWPNKDPNWSNVEANLKTGDPFVISFRIKATGSTIKPTIYIKPGLGYYSMVGTLSSDWSTIYYAGIWNDSETIQPHLGWSGISVASTYYIESVKLEKGNKPTDWTPAPEDTQASIDSLSDYTNLIRNWYANCATAAGTAAKIATINPETTDFTTSILTPGTVVFVKFATTNSAAVDGLTLNINNTGAKPIRQVRNGTVQNLPGVGYLAADATYQFTYDGANWLYTGNYDSNSNDNARYVQFYNTIVAGEALAAASIIGGRTDGKFYQIKENSSFDLSHPLLWTTAAIAKDATNYANIYTQCYDRTLATFYTSFTNTTANCIVYLVGTVNGNTFTTYGSNSSQYLTINPPTTADGRFYIPIGRLGNQSNGKNYFNYQVGMPVTLYAFVDGKFRQVTPTEIVATQRVYYRSKASGTFADEYKPTAWVTQSTDKYNENTSTADGWSTKVTPIAAIRSADSSSKYLYLYTCEQRKRLDGTVEHTDILLDDSTTIIDGGNIITGSISANEITAEAISGENGWINLHEGTFGYTNSDTGHGISWDGDDLHVSGDIVVSYSQIDDAPTSIAEFADAKNYVTEENLVTQLNGLDESIGSTNGAVASLSEQVSSQGNNLETLSGTVGRATSDISTLQTTVEEHNNQLNSLGSFTTIEPGQVTLALAGSPVQTVLTGTGLSFLAVNQEQPIAYLGVDEQTGVGKLYVTNAVVVQDMELGDWAWTARKNRHLTLKYIGS